MRKYKIKLVGYYAPCFDDEEVMVEADNDYNAITKAKLLYPQAESVVIIDIYE